MFARCVFTCMIALFAVASLGKAADFPIRAEDSDKLQRGWKMETEVTVSSAGRLDGETTLICTDAAFGFKGGVVILLADKDGNVLWRSSAKHGGVNAAGFARRRTERITWGDEFPKELVGKIEGVEIVHAHMPDDNLWKQRCDQVIEIGKGVAEIAAKLKKKD